MGEVTEPVHEHMLGLGLGALTHANWHANYYSQTNAYWPELSVLQAAHAAEILIKARIAQEHPLLIFDDLPTFGQIDGEEVMRNDLAEHGRTYQWAELPDRLWATTGLTIPDLERYRDFGRLRNSIQHFAGATNINFSQATIDFIYGVIDPFINDCWGLFAIDFNEDYEPYEYLVEGLLKSGVRFLVSAGAAADFKFVSVRWPSDDSEYRKEMEGRFDSAIEARSDG